MKKVILLIIYSFVSVLVIEKYVYADTNLQPKFTGIDVIVSGIEGEDFAVERLWYDLETDDRLVLYLKSNVQISFLHNNDNIIGHRRVIDVSGAHPGYVYYKIDGDELRSVGHKYASKPTYLASTALEKPEYRNIIIFKYDDTGPFTLAPFKGKVGDNGIPEYEEGHFHWGQVDSYGDEWHTLTFWDDDPETNTEQDRRSLASSDGKIIHVVVDPQTPVFSVTASGGEEFYTTPPKTYYTPYIHEQKTYLTSGIRIKLANIFNGESIWYQIDNGGWIQYQAELIASDLFNTDDGVYHMQYRIGNEGVVKTRMIHYNPSQPAQNENHPRLYFEGMSEVQEIRTNVHGGDPDATDAYRQTLRRCESYDQGLDYRCGIRNFNGYFKPGSSEGYYYMTRRLVGAIATEAYVGIIEDDAQRLRRVKDGLLVVYTVDPLGCEDGDGRLGAPCQERAMYSNGRCHNGAARAYDVIFHFTRENGYAEGMTPIQHIKIRDNLANEASILIKYPETWPTNFLGNVSNWKAGTRATQLEITTVSYALAIPSYDTPYYGTSGADGVTIPTHVYAPLVEMPIAWSDLHFKGKVVNPSNPSQGRLSAAACTFDTDGWYLGNAREGYLGMMYSDLLPFLIYRHNFDGYHYENIENHLKKQILDRYPFNGARVPVTYYQGGFVERVDVSSLVNAKFNDAGLYRWSLEFPTSITSKNFGIEAEAPLMKELIGKNYALLSSDFNDPQGIYFRTAMFNSEAPISSGNYQNYWGGHFNMAAYGERLAIELCGYQHEDWGIVVRSDRKNVILVDGQTEPNYQQFKGGVIHDLLCDQIAYVNLESDHSIRDSGGIYAQKGINLSRHVFFPDRLFFVMVDQLTSSTGSHEYQWLMHGTTGGNQSADAFTKDLNNDKAIWKKVSGVKLVAQFISDVELNQEDLRMYDYLEDTGMEPYISAKRSGEKTTFLTVLYPLDVNQAEPQIIREIHEGFSSGKLINNTGIFNFACRDKTGDSLEIHSGDVRALADIVLVKKNNEIMEYALAINALKTIIEDKELFNADKPVNVMMRQEEQDGEMYMYVTVENLTGGIATVEFIAENTVQISLEGNEKRSFSYNFSGLIIDGEIQEEENDEISSIPDKWDLKCYNNIFIPSQSQPVRIKVAVKETRHVSVIIYDAKGNKVKTIVDDTMNAEVYDFTWEGKDDSDNKVGSGIYIVHMKAGKYTETKKIAVIK